MSLYNNNGEECLLTPNNAPFSLDHNDSKTLQPSKLILGQVLDALYIVISNNLFSHGIKSFILPESVFTRIHQHISLESVGPNDCCDIDFITSFLIHIVALIYLLDIRKKYILYLDPIVSGYVSKDK